LTTTKRQASIDAKEPFMRRLLVLVGASLLPVVPALLPAGHELEAQVPSPPGTVEVTVREERLSVNVRDASLADILRVIGQEGDLKLHLDGQFRTAITTSFTGLPLESGIRRLARGHSTTFAYGPPSRPGGVGRLTEIWIIETSPAASARPVDPQTRGARLAHLGALGRRQDDEAVAELARILTQDPDPVVRTQAVLAVGRRGDPRTAPALIAALADQQPSVRIQAVRGLRRVEGERSAEVLGRVLLSDADPVVRRVTASILASLRHAAAGSALRTAMSADSDPLVREAAASAYRRWARPLRVQPGQ
jgi:hypothetical protein